MNELHAARTATNNVHQNISPLPLKMTYLLLLQVPLKIKGFLTFVKPDICDHQHSITLTCTCCVYMHGCGLIVYMQGCVLVVYMHGCGLIVYMRGCVLIVYVHGCVRIVYIHGCGLIVIQNFSTHSVC